jgi:hypothetical protein
VKRRRPFVGSAVLAALAAIPLVVILIVLPGQRSRALDVFVLFLGACALLALARLTSENEQREPSPFDEPAAKPPRPERLPELARIEREVVLSTGSEFDQQVRLRPLLRDIAEHRLWSRRGVVLEESPVRAEELLGAEVWELVRPGPPAADRRYWSAVELGELTRLVDRLEGV